MSATDVVSALRAKKLKLATAESCTGGMIAVAITDIAGSSDVFDRGFVTYSNDAKTEMLSVPPEVLMRYGAVSQETAEAMARGAIDHSHADIAVAITGIAGPTGGSREKPVGLVHFALADKFGSVTHRMLVFREEGREAIRRAARDVALNFVYDELGKLR